METSEQIWLHFEKNLRSFILSKIPEEAVAEDILQEVFIRIHLKIDTLRDSTLISSWIYQITRNLIIDHFRSHKKEILHPADLPETVLEDPDRGQMEEALQDMVKMMDNMPAENCDAICMTDIRGMSQKDYARSIGISYTAAKSRIQRSRKMLKDMLMKCCHYEFDKYGTVLEITPNQCCCCHPG